jgi:hypothetical protein
MAQNTPLFTAHAQFVADSVLNTEEALRQGLASSSTSSSKITSEESNETEQTRSEKSEERAAPGSSRGEFGVTEARPDGATTDCQPTGTSPIHIPHEDDSRGSARGLVTAEQLFPVVDHQIRRAPISVTFEEVEDEVSGKSKEADEKVKNSMPTQPSIVDQLLNENEQILYGPLYNSQALQGYILLCCQVFDGGLRDKPGKSPDYYHTCYCLSGLAQAQNSASHRINAPPPPKAVLGPYTNLLEPVHPLCNLDLSKYNDAVRYFRHRPF